MMELEKGVNPELWQTCAGPIVQIPSVNSIVCYFPQGHAEHAGSSLDFSSIRGIPAVIRCRVGGVKYLADVDSDEVYAKIRLIPILDLDLDDEIDSGINESDNLEELSTFAKALTQSDANNGGGFSVPRYCAETIFPALKYTADPPVQNVIATDVHGVSWKFRHIYRGTPRRHLLTTGWSTFVNHKNLVAGDLIVFVKNKRDDIHVGIRRSRRKEEAVMNPPSRWSSDHGRSVSPYGGSVMRGEEKSNMMSRRDVNSNGASWGVVRLDPVLEAMSLAANGKPFEIVFYPRGSSLEFCVKASAVRAAMRTSWSLGLRFKMPYETEESSRISWFMGSVTNADVVDPIRWPNSPWRLLQVKWEEKELHFMKRVSPWMVELVHNMPAIHLAPFPSPRKKLRCPQPLDFHFDGQFQLPLFSGDPFRPNSPLCSLSDNTSAGIQGARHAKFGRSFSDLHLNNKLQSGSILSSFEQLNPHSSSSDTLMGANTKSNENVTRLLTSGNSSQNLERTHNLKRRQFLLFGKLILIEQEMEDSGSGDAVSEVHTREDFRERNADETKSFINDLQSSHEQSVSSVKSYPTVISQNDGVQTAKPAFNTGHCKVFMDSMDVGSTIDLSVLSSYDELYKRLANMLGTEISKPFNHVTYHDGTGVIKQAGDEPFSDFIKTAKSLTIMMDPKDDNVGKTWITSKRNAA